MCRNRINKISTDRRAKKKSSISKLEEPVILKIKGSKSILPGDKRPASNNAKGQKADKAPEPKHGTPVRIAKMPRTVSITQGLSIGSDQIKEKNVDYKPKPIERKEVTGTNSFSVKEVVKVIKYYIEEQKIGASKKTAFTTYNPEISDISNITFIVENSYEEEAIKEYRAGLVRALRKKLNNRNIDIQTRLVESGEEKVLLVTDKQRFDYLLDKYPEIDKLRKTFNLDFQ